MTTNELRAKFEAFFSDCNLRRLNMRSDCYEDARIALLWEGWQAAYDSRDAEIEALRTDAQRWRSLVAENNKGPHGKFRICWLDPSHEGFITTDGVSCNGKDEAAIVRVFDAAMQEVE